MFDSHTKYYKLILNRWSTISNSYFSGAPCRRNSLSNDTKT